jgi:hypothetical protein
MLKAYHCHHFQKFLGSLGSIQTIKSNRKMKSKILVQFYWFKFVSHSYPGKQEMFFCTSHFFLFAILYASFGSLTQVPLGVDTPPGNPEMTVEAKAETEKAQQGDDLSQLKYFTFEDYSHILSNQRINLI